MAQPETKTVTLIGAPTDVGAGARGGSMGPEALRVAGIARAISRLGFTVQDAGDVAGPPNPEEEPRDGYRNFDEVLAWCTGLRDAVYDALSAETMPLTMGGDHCLAIGSVAGVARWCAEHDVPLSVIWLDAHADFNGPETTPSGNIHGMPAAFLCGMGEPRLAGIGPAVPILDPARLVQIGIRSVDALEKLRLNDHAVEVFDMRRIDEMGMRDVMNRALEIAGRDGGHVHVTFDVDFLDPSIAPGVATTVPGGPTYREAQLCMEMIHDAGLMGSLDVFELNPAYDIQNQTAAIAVELVESLFGQQTLARKGDDRRYLK